MKGTRETYVRHGESVKGMERAEVVDERLRYCGVAVLHESISAWWGLGSRQARPADR